MYFFRINTDITKKIRIKLKLIVIVLEIYFQNSMAISKNNLLLPFLLIFEFENRE